MGRRKIPIEPIENRSNRNVTYTKRRNGLMKKADELSVLCDVDVVVIMFSPSGKLAVLNGKTEEVLARYANTDQAERTKAIQDAAARFRQYARTEQTFQDVDPLNNTVELEQAVERPEERMNQLQEPQPGFDTMAPPPPEGSTSPLPSWNIDGINWDELPDLGGKLVDWLDVIKNLVPGTVNCCHYSRQPGT